MSQFQLKSIVLAGLLGASVGTAHGGYPKDAVRRCNSDAVVSGTVCMDKYEASMWRVPSGSSALIRRIKRGIATEATLIAGGAVRLGETFTNTNYPPCDEFGLECSDVYAVSLPNVLPSVVATWFQAQQACKNSGKRLPTRAEWQAGVMGTPDPVGNDDNGVTDCNTDSTLFPSPTGSRSDCVSNDGAFDMVGNVWEWTAELLGTLSCSNFWGPGGDWSCLNHGTTGAGPLALTAGGSFIDESAAGPFALADGRPNSADGNMGFRCVR